MSNISFDEATHNLWQRHMKELNDYLHNPKEYPEYCQEWVTFVEKRTANILSIGGDVTSYNYQTEFEQNWKTRIYDIMKENWKKKKSCLSHLIKSKHKYRSLEEMLSKVEYRVKQNIRDSSSSSSSSSSSPRYSRNKKKKSNKNKWLSSSSSSSSYSSSDTSSDYSHSSKRRRRRRKSGNSRKCSVCKRRRSCSCRRYCKPRRRKSSSSEYSKSRSRSCSRKRTRSRTTSRSRSRTGSRYRSSKNMEKCSRSRSRSRTTSREKFASSDLSKFETRSRKRSNSNSFSGKRFPSQDNCKVSNSRSHSRTFSKRSRSRSISKGSMSRTISKRSRTSTGSKRSRSKSGSRSVSKSHKCRSRSMSASRSPRPKIASRSRSRTDSRSRITPERTRSGNFSGTCSSIKHKIETGAGSKNGNEENINTQESMITPSANDKLNVSSGCGNDEPESENPTMSPIGETLCLNKLSLENSSHTSSFHLPLDKIVKTVESSEKFPDKSNSPLRSKEISEEDIKKCLIDTLYLLITYKDKLGSFFIIIKNIFAKLQEILISKDDKDLSALKTLDFILAMRLVQDKLRVIGFSSPVKDEISLQVVDKIEVMIKLFFPMENVLPVVMYGLNLKDIATTIRNKSENDAKLFIEFILKYEGLKGITSKEVDEVYVTSLQTLEKECN